jgi:hypothetical protein
MAPEQVLICIFDIPEKFLLHGHRSMGTSKILEIQGQGKLASRVSMDRQGSAGQILGMRSLLISLDSRFGL